MRHTIAGDQCVALTLRTASWHGHAKHLTIPHHFTPQGREKAIEFVHADEKLRKELEEATRAALSGAPSALADGRGSDEEDLVEEEEGQCYGGHRCICMPPHPSALHTTGYSLEVQSAGCHALPGLLMTHRWP